MLRFSSFALLAAFLVLSGCRSTVQDAYFNTLERLGKDKRELLGQRVEAARDSQEDAKEEFQSALEQFQALTGYDGGDLQETYERLNDAYERSQDRAETVSERVEAVDDVAQALFREWEAELDEYSDAGLRRRSEGQLRDARSRYGELFRAMGRAESSMQPVLGVLGDQVLYLKHNLNARAVAALDDEVARLETDVAALIRDMERSIDEANAFIREMDLG